MAFVHSKSTRVMFNELHASAKLRGVTVTNERAMSSVTSLVDEGERFQPGLRAGSLSLDGMFEDNELLDEIVAADGVNNALLISAGADGWAVGKPVGMVLADLSSHGITSAVADTVGFTVESTADEFADLGVSLHDHVAATATANGASVDNTDPTTGGGVAVLHVTAASVADTLDVKVQHSTDNSVWVDLVAFTQATAVTSERKTVAGAVNRYVRGSWTIAGTAPSFTFIAAFARR